MPGLETFAQLLIPELRLHLYLTQRGCDLGAFGRYPASLGCVGGLPQDASGGKKWGSLQEEFMKRVF